MANLKTTLCGLEMDSPFVMGSGPCGWDADALIACSKAGAGAVVTKSVKHVGFVNTTQHMVSNGLNSLLNNEGGSDLDLKQWVEYEIPKAKDAGVKNLIGSVCGYGTMEETLDIATQLEAAGSDMLEVVGDYHDPKDLVDLVGGIKKVVKIPVIAKVNGNWTDTEAVAKYCEQAGADAITAIDSIGPCFRVDIATGRPLIGGKSVGYLTGAPILPVALRYVHDISNYVKSDLIGLGGVTTAEAALEMLMAGANAVGVCTLPIVQGPGAFTKLCNDLNKLMDKYGYEDIASVSGLCNRTEPLPERSTADFHFDAEKCTKCGRCVKACAYRARTLDENGNMNVDSEACRICGLCFGMCPTKAITIG